MFLPGHPIIKQSLKAAFIPTKNAGTYVPPAKSVRTRVDSRQVLTYYLNAYMNIEECLPCRE